MYLVINAESFVMQMNPRRMPILPKINHTH